MAEAQEHIHSAGTIVEYSEDDVTYVDLVDVIAIMPPPLDHAESDDTHLLSPSGVKESGAGWGTPGDATLDLHWLKDQEEALDEYQLARTTLYWRITLPELSSEASGSIIKFQAWIKSKKESQLGKDTDDKFHNERALHMTGPPTMTPGA